MRSEVNRLKKCLAEKDALIASKDALIERKDATLEKFLSRLTVNAAEMTTSSPGFQLTPVLFRGPPTSPVSRMMLEQQPANAHIKSKYRGVDWFKRDGKWRVRGPKESNHKTLGYFTDESEAARKFDEHVSALGWPQAKRNFPLS